MLADILHALASQFTDEEDHPYYPRPSTSGPERCIRQLVYWGLGIPKKPLPGRTLHIFDDGNFHEELVADWIRKSAYKLHSEQMEVTIEEQGIKLTGHIDGIITDLLGQDYLWENKSINHFTCQRFWSGVIPLDYMSQIALYLRGLQQVNPELTEGILLIKNKNTSAYLEFIVSYNTNRDTLIIKNRTSSQGETTEMNESLENITHNAFNKFVKINEALEKKEIPPRQYNRGEDWQCDYCQYLEPCYQNYEEEFEALQSDVELEGEIVELCKYYLETAMHEKEMKKEKDVLKDKIKTILEAQGVRKGKAGDYYIENRLQRRKTLDKELIPPEIIMQATGTSIFPVLTIRKRKE